MGAPTPDSRGTIGGVGAGTPNAKAGVLPELSDYDKRLKALNEAPDATDAILRSQRTAVSTSRRGSFLTGPGGTGGVNSIGSGPSLGTDETGANRKKMGGMSEDALTNILRQRGW